LPDKRNLNVPPAAARRRYGLAPTPSPAPRAPTGVQHGWPERPTAHQAVLMRTARSALLRWKRRSASAPCPRAAGQDDVLSSVPMNESARAIKAIEHAQQQVDTAKWLVGVNPAAKRLHRAGRVPVL
jgi:hypothetical protein